MSGRRGDTTSRGFTWRTDRMRVLTRILFSLFAAGSICAATGAQEPLSPATPASVSQSINAFRNNVAPILEKRCWECHSGNSPEANLRLDSADGLRTGGDQGPIFVAGEPEKSLLVELISGDEPEMPMDGDPLAADEVAGIRDWIASGAAIPEPWPTSAKPLGVGHWSLQKIIRPTVPAVNDATWPANPIDQFILAELEQNGLGPSPLADRRTLIRRLSYGVCGLPPSPEEVHQFAYTDNPRAYSDLVDRLLDSPHYGERWARYWLDVVRFAESNGFETNIPRGNAWPYRDYVIRALNEDRPYNRFVLEQLAGDVLGVDEATGFLVAGAWDQVKSPDPVLTANQRADELHDMVSTTASAFLGLTVGCARCHDHKFDPIPQTDYYAITACLSGVQHGERPYRTEAVSSSAEEMDAARQQLVRLDDALRPFEMLCRVSEDSNRPVAHPLRVPVRPQRNIERFAPVAAKWIRFTILRTTDLEPCIDELEVFAADAPTKNVALAEFGTRPTASGVYPNSEIHRLEHINDGRYGNGRSWISNEFGQGWVQLEFAETVSIDRIMWGRDRERQFSDRLAVDYRIEISPDGANWQVVASSEDRQPYDPAHPAASEYGGESLTESQRNELAQRIAEREKLETHLRELTQVPMAYAGTFLVEPEPTHRFFRGDPLQKREPVAPGALAAVAAPFGLPAEAGESERRLALANWIVDPENPLAARVIVNRLWQYHFGEGLVSTPSDFGANGAKPSHPALLDWLAAELIDHDWSLKHIHRLILNSKTYQQSSDLRTDCAARDAAARLLWRFPPKRLEAEPIRDSILAASGKLDLRMGGPGFSVFEPNENYVRVYTPRREFNSEQWRRMIYATVIRQRLDGVFGAFDCPDGGQIAPKRNRSTTPLQALNLLNSPFMIEQAGFLAERIQSEVGADPSAQIRRAFALVYQREPTSDELDAIVPQIPSLGLAAICRALFSTNEFIYVY